MDQHEKSPQRLWYEANCNSIRSKASYVAHFPGYIGAILAGNSEHFALMSASILNVLGGLIGWIVSKSIEDIKREKAGEIANPPTERHIITRKNLYRSISIHSGPQAPA